MGHQNDVLVEFVGVQKTYDGETLVIKGLDLQIRRGEFMTLLGPSGSGKTTCLMMLAGFEAVTGGRIMLNRRTINDVPPYKRDIGIVFQNYALFPHMTAAENISYPLKIRRVPKAEIRQRVQNVLAMVQLDDFGTRRPGQLSGGQQQRVALARALVFEPQLVLMDEPLGALDKRLREQMQYEIRQIHTNLGVTMVYVTHDQSEALIMSDRIAVLNHGMIEQQATPSALYDKPESVFVARFIGENNCLAGSVSSVSGDSCTVKMDTGETVRALAVRVGAVGSRTSVLVRPESVRVARPGEPFANQFDGEIREVIYAGDHGRVRMSLFGRDDFILKVPKSGLADGGLVPGNALQVGWQVEDCRALGGSAEGSG
jgi:putative spermidine/putrescine transport system ATP-binding protein